MRGVLGAEVLAREPEDGQRAERDRERLDREQHVRARPGEPERRERGEDRVEVRAEPRGLLAGQVRDLEEVAVRGRPDRLRHVAEVEATGLEGTLARDRERGEADGERGDGGPEKARGISPELLQECSPTEPEDVLARVLAVGGETAGGEPLGEPGIGREPANRLRPAPPRRRAGRAVRSRRRRAARGRAGVSAVTSGVPHASAWNALFGITRAAFSDVPKTPSAQPARCSSAGRSSYSTHGTCSTLRRRLGEQRVELAGADDRGTGSPARAEPPRGSSRGRAAGSACRRKGT